MGVADNQSYKNQYHFTDDSKSTAEKSPSIEKDPKINTTIKENPYRSNVEIEGGEIVLQPDLSALFKAMGKRHSKGGMDVLLKPNSFVFSDYDGLKFSPKMHEALDLKEGGTPADTLKKNVNLKHYNKMVEIMDNPFKDDLAKNSAAKMLDKYISMLGNIAFAQEQKKGFPTGLPEFSIGTAPVYDKDLKMDMDANKQFMRAGGKIMQRVGRNPYSGGLKGYLFDDNYYPSTTQTTTQPIPTVSLNLNPLTATPQNVFDTDWYKLLNGNQNAILSKEAKANLAQQILSPQHKRNTGLYGDSDWDISDFQARHQWYLQNHPNFNPANPQDVQDFQNEYNKKSQELFGRPYFTGKGFRAVDSKFGEYTYNAPSLNGTPTPAVTTTPSTTTQTTVTTPTATIPVPKAPELDITAQGVKRAGWEFTPWQKLSQLYNWGQYANVKRYMPYRSRYNATYVDPALMNPEQAVGDAKSAFHQQLESLNTLNPTLRNAQAAANYGNMLGAIPGIRAQYDNQNVGIINQSRQYNNQVKNNETMLNMGNDQQYYQAAVQGRANFDNMRQYLSNQAMNNTLRDVETNQKLAYNLLTQNNPAYNYDWKTGNFTRTNKSILDASAGQTTNTLYDDIIKGIQNLPDSDPRKWDIYERLLRQKNILPYLNQQTGVPGYKKGGSVKKNPYK